jgi:hypothetical protein
MLCSSAALVKPCLSAPIIVEQLPLTDDQHISAVLSPYGCSGQLLRYLLDVLLWPMPTLLRAVPAPLELACKKVGKIPIWRHMPVTNENLAHQSLSQEIS